MNHIMKSIIIVTALLAFAGYAVAEGTGTGSVWNDADTASPLIVRYVGPETATIQVAAGSIIQVTDTTSTTTSLATVTLATLKGALQAAEDDEGDKQWEVMYWAGIAADSVTTNDLIVVAANAVDKEWDYSIKWDVSNEKHYDTVVSQPPVGKNASISGPSTLLSLCGEPAGTGDATVSVYVGGERKFYQTITSPVYVPSVTNVTNTADNSIDLSDIDLGAGIRIGQEVGFVRCARATTATTGGIGASVSRP